MTASAHGSKRISVQWLPPPSDEQNGLIRSYFVALYSKNGNKTESISANLFSANISGLRPYTTYLCYVHAITIGIGPPTLVNVTTDEDGMYIF